MTEARDLAHQVLLGREVVEEGLVRDVGALADVGDLGGLDAALAEQRGRRLRRCGRRSPGGGARGGWAAVDNGSNHRLEVYCRNGRIAMDASTAPDPFLELLTAKDPAPLVHRLRAEDPVHFVPSLGFWFVTRHDDVKRLFNDPENATQDRTAWEHFLPRARGLDAALVPRQQLRAAGAGGARALPPPVQRRAHAARGAAHGRADPRGGGALREAAARSPGRGARPDGRLHQPDSERGDQPRHRRAARRRRAALPRARAGPDPRLLPVRAAGGAGAGRVFAPGDGGLGAGDGRRTAPHARRGSDLRSDPHPGARRDAQRRRDRDADLGPDRRRQRDHQPRRPRDDPDAARAPASS